MTTYFLNDGGSPIAEETWNGTAATFTNLNGWTADGWRARYDGTQAYDFVYDPQGSVVQRQTAGTYGAGGAATDEAFYEGYGALRQANKGSTGAGVGQPDPSGFGGQYGYYTDTETGLLCLTHRYYDPGTGKFINRDPIGYAGGANLYGFCGGNPVNEIDPNGTDVFDALADGSYAAGGIISGGLTNRIDHWLGVDSGIDRNSTAYHVGTAIGYAHVAASTVVGGVGIVNAVRAYRVARAAGAVAAAGGAAPAITAAAARVAANRVNGIAAQNQLLGLVAGAQQVFFRTTLGARYVDVLDAANVAHESKVGYTVLSNSITRQILKDSELLTTGQVRGVTWHFFRSPVTGLRGASQPLIDELARHGISTVFH